MQELMKFCMVLYVNAEQSFRPEYVLFPASSSSGLLAASFVPDEATEAPLRSPHDSRHSDFFLAFGIRRPNSTKLLGQRYDRRLFRIRLENLSENPIVDVIRGCPTIALHKFLSECMMQSSRRFGLLLSDPYCNPRGDQTW